MLLHPTTHFPSSQGYDELNTLERPLVSDAHEQEEYERQHGVSAPGAAAGFRPAPGGYGGYAPPPTSAGAAGYPPQGYGTMPPAAAGVQRTSAQPLPSQVRGAGCQLPASAPLLGQAESELECMPLGGALLLALLCSSLHLASLPIERPPHAAHLFGCTRCVLCLASA